MESFSHPIRRVISLLVFALFFGAAWTTPARAQKQEGVIRGRITDPSGALVPHAHLTLHSDAQPDRTTDSGDYGDFRFADIPAGTYSLAVQANGFQNDQQKLVLKPAQELTVSLKLKIEVDRQQIAVSAEGLDSGPDRNLGALVLRGSDLDALPTNSQELKRQLTAMAGSDISPQFYVDGFTAGHLPPKASIKEIRMNEDPYSAQYDTPGLDRIEITTKPGSDRLHGNLEIIGEDSSLNSRNPYVLDQPAYSAFYSQGDVSGPLARTSSWFLTGAQQNIGTQSFIHAVTSSTGPAYTQALSSPQTSTEFTPRADFQLGKVHSLSIQYDWDRDAQNNLVQSQLSLPTQAMNTRHMEQTLRFTDTQTYSENLVNEVRFQYIHVNDRFLPLNSDSSVLVQGAFNGGGNNLGQAHDVQNRYEFQEHVSLLRGNHLLLFGGRLRDTQDTNSSTGGHNGEFIFPSITAYEITQQGISDGRTPEQIRAQGGGASQFIITAGKPKASVDVADVGLYIEDQWKLNPSMTLSPGLRYETQSGIHDHADFAPRVSYGWSIGAGNGKPALAVLRAGAGLFYQRFTSDLALNAARQNGILEQQYVVKNPDFYPNVPSPGDLGPAMLPTIYRIDRRLRAPSLFQATIGVDKQFSKRLSVHADYTYYRGFDLLLTRNINAPLPATYDPADPASGTRPLGTLQNIYEYQSEGKSRRDQLYVTVRFTTKPALLYGYYICGKREANTDGAATFPSDQYNLQADYGRAANDVRNRVYVGGIVHLPFQLEANPFLIVESSGPFNITVGQDLNGDSQFNDRPAFATDLSRPSVYRTRWGNFDADPMSGQKIIPANYGIGPALILLNMTLSRTIPFGPKLEQPPAPGLSASGAEMPRRFQWNVGLEAQNVFNNVNGGPPLGVLGSPLFGHSINISANQFSNPQANRLIYLHSVVSF